MTTITPKVSGVTFLDIEDARRFFAERDEAPNVAHQFRTRDPAIREAEKEAKRTKPVVVTFDAPYWLVLTPPAKQ